MSPQQIAPNASARETILDAALVALAILPISGAAIVAALLPQALMHGHSLIGHVRQ
jgi:hypothetical protein